MTSGSLIKYVMTGLLGWTGRRRLVTRAIFPINLLDTYIIYYIEGNKRLADLNDNLDRKP